ncbi:MAG: hypothetical protein KDD60_01760 [Bdellovibrionales bacterium]|nr:hypothetical protein [Bdellovibrionales bacterium]
MVERKFDSGEVSDGISQYRHLKREQQSIHGRGIMRRGNNNRRGNSGNGRGGRGNGGGGGGGGRGRGGNKRGGGGGGHYRGGNGGGGKRGRGGRRRGGGTAESGNARERIQVESGALVLIDQFMLANPQVLARLNDLIDEDPEKKNEVVEQFGGAVVNLAPNTYRIARDPFASTIVIHPDGEKAEVDSTSANEATGRVFIDTRCLAMVDRELLDDIPLLEKYQQLWVTGQDKACRDLLRDNGGAVRYGFERFGDELSVYVDADENTVAMWPDVIENPTPSSSEDEVAGATAV